MQNNLDKYDQNLKTILDSYRPSYSGKAWGRLNSDLPKSSNRWYYGFASAVILIMIPAIIYQLYSDENIEQINLVEAQNPIINTDNRAVVAEINDIDTEEDVIVAAQSLISTVQEKVKEEIQKQELKEKGNVLPQKEQLLESENKTLENEEIFVSEENKEAQQVVELHPKMILNAKETCAPFAGEFDIANLPQEAKVLWKISDIYTTETKSFDYQFTKAGKYSILLKITTESETYQLEDELIVLETPKADFKFTEEEGQIFVENTSVKYDHLLWSFPGIETEEQNPTFEVLYSGKYPLSLKVSNSSGCESSIQKIIDFEVKHNIFAPDAFTPDGDGMNDEFKVKYKQRAGYVYTFQVYNSKGHKLFETQDPEKGWAGEQHENNSNLKNEKYLWRLIITEPRGLTQLKEGYFVQL